jgi:hypothetical protein
MLFGELEKARMNGDMSNEKGSRAEIEAKRKSEAAQRQLEDARRRLVGDCLDLLSPGNITGWLPTSTAIVGYASVVSTLLSSKDIWDRMK